MYSKNNGNGITRVLEWQDTDGRWYASSFGAVASYEALVASIPAAQRADCRWRVRSYCRLGVHVAELP